MLESLANLADCELIFKYAIEFPQTKLIYTLAKSLDASLFYQLSTKLDVMNDAAFTAINTKILPGVLAKVETNAPLNYAAWEGDYRSIALLIRYGVDVDKKNQYNLPAGVLPVRLV